MELIVVHNNNDELSDDGFLLRFALSTEPVASVFLDGLAASCRFGSRKKVYIAVPAQWCPESRREGPAVIHYEKARGISCRRSEYAEERWFVISNARFATNTRWKWLRDVLNSVADDVVVVNMSPTLQAYREKVRITPDSKLVGFRRWYFDTVQPSEIPPDWPHHLFVKTNAFEKLLVDGALTLDFEKFLSRCRDNSLTLNCLEVAGGVWDLETEKGLLCFLEAVLNSKRLSGPNKKTVAENVRLFGKILTGKNVRIGRNAVISGPAILSDNVEIGDGAVVRNSIIAPGLSIRKEQFLQNRVLTKDYQKNQQSGPGGECNPMTTLYETKDSFDVRDAKSTFRNWGVFSYVTFVKRIFDIIGASIILLFFAPVFPIVALIIKLTSPGPVFYKARRQGMHGRQFNCLKFRSMAVGAEEIQERLRVVSQVDGPQFKIEKDPRVSAVGQFLRNTYLDEIPQFINVLLGQMSIVGPRPSPEKENSLCPRWRDARLSVRPGITGLWQICRTRAESKDFQEWLHYDTEYVRNLSVWLDLWVCWKTASKLVNNFIDQF